MAEEMVRVTRPGGLVFISYTTWYGPWGGHETSPWHFLGGRRARRRYAAKHGHEPKNKYGESLFAVTVADGLRWARTQQHADVVAPAPALQPVVEPLAAPRAGGARGGDVEPRARAAEEVTQDVSRFRWRLLAACAAAARPGHDPVAGPPGRRHQARPGRSRRWTSWRGPRTCGTPRAPSVSSRTRPTATSGRWVRSSRSGLVLDVPGLGGPAALDGAGPVRGLRRRRQGRARPRGALRPRLHRRRASPSRCPRGCSPCSDRSRSRSGRAPWRRGCCCRW